MRLAQGWTKFSSYIKTHAEENNLKNHTLHRPLNQIYLLEVKENSRKILV